MLQVGRLSNAVRLLVICLVGCGLQAQMAENEIKAAMLFNFTRFMEWPSTAWKDPQSPLLIGIVGADPFGPAFDEALRGKSSNGRPIRLLRLKSHQQAQSCHIVFISRSERSNVQEILRTLHPLPVLTVSDLEEFVDAGGMIGFVTVENRVRFEVNSGAANRAGITISSKLLRLAIANSRPAGTD